MDSNYNFTEEEISLKDLVLALWRQKVFIIAITLIAAILTGLYSMFMIAPVYHSKLSIVMNMPGIYATKYGNYTLPLKNNQQYINLITSNDILINTINDMGYASDDVTIENLRERITVGNVTTNAEQNSFEVSVAAGNPEEARKLAETLYANYVAFLDTMIAEGAVTYYYNDISNKIKSSQLDLKTYQALLEKNEELLEETPQTINQKDILKDIQTDDGRHYYIIENIINPVYTDIELDIIENKQMIHTIENNIALYETYQEELEMMQDDIAKYYETGKLTELQSNIGKIASTNVNLPSKPVAPSRKTSPSNARNGIIGGILGGMIAVLIALVKEYWFKNEKIKE